MICKCNHKIAYICRFGQAIRQSSWGSSLLKRYHLSPSQPSITVTLHRSMQLKMPSLLMKLSLRRCSERSLRVKTRSMTQCWALFVRSLQSSFFQIMSYLNKQRFPHNEIFKEKRLSIQILKWHQAIYLFCSNSWKRDCFFFPIITNMSQINSSTIFVVAIYSGKGKFPEGSCMWIFSFDVSNACEFHMNVCLIMIFTFQILFWSSVTWMIAL